MVGQRKVRAALAVKTKDVPHVLVRAKTVKASLSAHPELFPSPTIPLTTLDDQIANLEKAHAAATTTNTGTAAERNAPRDALCSSLNALRAYVQLVADANPDKAVATIESGGMRVAAAIVPSKPMLDARVDPQGNVLLRAHAKLLHKGKTARCFNWQYTVDGGKTWISAPSTAIAATSIPGLPPLTMCGFRVSVSHRGGQSEWSPMVTVVVH